MTFGIPLSSFAVNPEGNIKTKDHLRWIKTRRKYEQLIRQAHGLLPMLGIGVPSSSDVLFGRGKTYQFHPGNLKFNEDLEKHVDRYFAAKRQDKMDVAGDIVLTMKRDGTRFLRQDENGLWLEVDNATAADKVSHGFRNRKAMKKAETEKKKLREKRNQHTGATSSSSNQPLTASSNNRIASNDFKERNPPPPIQDCVSMKRLRTESVLPGRNLVM